MEKNIYQTQLEHSEKEGAIDIIYIASTPYSGSTILGFILGSSPKIGNVGELSYFNKLQKTDEICSCGVYSQECPFWSSIYKNNQIEDREHSIITKIKTSLMIAIGIKFPQQVLMNSNEYKLLSDMIINMKKDESETHYILDNSKSLWRLIDLLRYKELTIHVIHLKRDIFGNVSSFIKHKKGFWRGLIKYLSMNQLIKKFLRHNQVHHITVEYNKLCDNTEKEIEKIEEFLYMDLKPYCQNLNMKNMHVPSGNMGTRNLLQNYEGLKLDLSWENRLSGFQKMILKKLQE